MEIITFPGTTKLTRLLFFVKDISGIVGVDNEGKLQASISPIRESDPINGAVIVLKAIGKKVPLQEAGNFIDELMERFNTPAKVMEANKVSAERAQEIIVKFSIISLLFAIAEAGPDIFDSFTDNLSKMLNEVRNESDLTENKASEALNELLKGTKIKRDENPEQPT